jgi:hypothetical protein
MDRLSVISWGSAGAFSTASQIATRIVREDARMALEGGVEAVANAVKVTLGPKGRYVPG